MEKENSPEFKVLEAKREQESLVLSVEVSPDVVSRAYRKVHKQLLQHVHVPGFRPGKVPLPVLSNAVGRENFTKEVRKELLPRFYYDALGTTTYQPVDKVEYQDEHLSHGDPFTFKARVIVAPEARVTDYRALKPEIEEIPAVDDKAVDKVLERLQRDKAKNTRAEDEVVQDGDFVLISFTGSVGGRDFKTLSRENLGLTVGADEFLTGFDENLVGKRKGEEFTFPLTVPRKGTENEFLVGKKVMFKGKVKSVFRQELPPIDDAFARTAGSFENLDGLRERIRSDLDRSRDSKRSKALEDAVRQAIARAVDVNLPPALVEKRLDERVHEFQHGLEDRKLTLEDYLEEHGKTEESVRDELREKIVEELKVDFALDHVAREEGLVVSDEEFEGRIESMARVLNKDPGEILEALDEHGQRLTHRQEFLREKAFESVKSHYK